MPGEDTGKGAWRELLSEGRAFYTTLIVGGVALHATQMLVIAIIMPTVVADIGGASYYTWAAMLYTIGAIVGASSTAAVWARLGARKCYTIGALVFAFGTALCALAPDMGTLIVARGVQGWAGGLVAGRGQALVTSLYDARLRTRMLAIVQGAFTVCHLSGPVVGGMFAAVDWWRGSFWLMLPFMVAFAAIAWRKVPERLRDERAPSEVPRFPFWRLATLALGVCCVAATGPVESAALRVLLIIAAVGLVTLTFRLDRVADNKLFPSRALSIRAPVGVSLWILSLHAMAHASVNLFLPLLLQIVHGLTPVLINFVTIVISIGWTIGAFAVSGWSGSRERAALLFGPIACFVGLACMTWVALLPGLWLFTAGALLMGIGIGTYNVHLVARTMEGAASGEQRTTSAALVSVRSIGTAFGAAIAGVIAHTAGLGDATDADAVGRAVVAVFASCLVPLGLAVVLMLRFMRIGLSSAGRIRQATT
jgi:MFS family permease